MNGKDYEINGQTNDSERDSENHEIETIFADIESENITKSKTISKSIKNYESPGCVFARTGTTKSDAR
jgi:hypothetical protein